MTNAKAEDRQAEARATYNGVHAAADVLTRKDYDLINNVWVHVPSDTEMFSPNGTGVMALTDEPDFWAQGDHLEPYDLLVHLDHGGDVDNAADEVVGAAQNGGRAADADENRHKVLAFVNKECDKLRWPKILPGKTYTLLGSNRDGIQRWGLVGDENKAVYLTTYGDYLTVRIAHGLFTDEGAVLTKLEALARAQYGGDEQEAIDSLWTAPTPQGDGSHGRLLPDPDEAAKVLAAMNGDSVAYDPKDRCWRLYGDGSWKALEHDDPYLDSKLLEAAEQAGLYKSEQAIKATLRFARLRMMRDFHRKEEEKGQKASIAFSNGTQDLQAGVLRPHSPDDNLVNTLNYPFDPEGECPLTDALLRSSIPDTFDDEGNPTPDGATAREAVMAHFGLALMGDTTFERTIVLIGEPNSGKTTLVRLLNIIVGQPFDQFASYHVFDPGHEGQLARAACRDWYACAFDEFPEEALKQEDLFKCMSAHSGVPSRLHHQGLVTGQWVPKMLMATNDIMRLKDTSGAIKKRLLVIRTEGVVPYGSEDKLLPYKLKAEAGAFAVKCLEAARAAIARNAYPVSAKMNRDFDEMAAETDPIKAYVRERALLTVDDRLEHQIGSTTIYKDWSDYALKNGHQKGSHIWFTKRLTGYAPWRVTVVHRNAGNILQGITLRDGGSGTNRLKPSAKSSSGPAAAAPPHPANVQPAPPSSPAGASSAVGGEGFDAQGEALVKHLGEKLHPDLTSNTLGETAADAKSEACEAFLGETAIGERFSHTHAAGEEAAAGMEVAEGRVCESKIPNANNMAKNASHASPPAEYSGEHIEKASPNASPKLHQMLHQAFMCPPPKPSPALPLPPEEDCGRLLEAIASACCISPQTAADAAWAAVDALYHAGDARLQAWYGSDEMIEVLKERGLFRAWADHHLDC